MKNKSLVHILKKNSGRDNSGQVSVRHQGGRHKRYYRMIDFKRDKLNMSATVLSLEYDPNRNSEIALVQYIDGVKRYIIAPKDVGVGEVLVAGSGSRIKAGNALPLKDIPVGTFIHNIELVPGRGGKLVRAAGTAATILSKEGTNIQVKFPSGEVRIIPATAMATIGQVGNVEHRHEQLGKAGRSRRLGIRPTVRGVAQNPRSHPHGGGEGRSGIGMPSPKSPWGKPTLGKKTRKPNRFSSKYIVSRRKK